MYSWHGILAKALRWYFEAGMRMIERHFALSRLLAAHIVLYE